MYTLTKRATGADRARKRIHTAGEALVPTFADDGTVQVQTSRSATVHALRRRGWRVADYAQADAPVPADPPAPVAPPADDPPGDPDDDGDRPERWHELKAMTVKQLRTVARDLSIRGRSSMGEDALIAAIMDAEA